MRRRRRSSPPAPPWTAAGDAPAAGLLALCAVAQLGLGAYFMLLRPPLLPEDLRFLALGADQTPPRLPVWLDLVFLVLGGQMAAVGALTGALALRVRTVRPSTADLMLTAFAGATSAGMMSAVNFALGSDFRWALVGPVLLWAAAAGALLRAKLRAD